MFEELPLVQFSEVITAQGEIQVEHETAPVSRFRLSRSKHDFHSPWEFEVFVNEDSRDEFDRALHRRSFPKFVGKTSTGHSIEVPNLRWRVWAKGSGTLTGVVWDVLIDPEPVPAKPNRQVVTIDLSPTTMALEEKRFLTRWYTGEIKHDETLSPEPDEKLLYWEGSRGRITVVCYYKYENARVGDSQSLVRIPASTLQLRLEGDQTSTDPRSLADSMAREIEDPLRLISYLSRSHVRWSAITVFSEWKDGDGRPNLHEMHMLRAGVLGDYKSNRDWGLANPYNMAPDGLNTMVTALQQSPYRDVLLTAMVYLVTGNDTRIPELTLVSSFTALETITNGIGKIDRTNQILDRGAFKKLRKQIESTIGSHAKNEGFAVLQVPLIVAKLGELNRPAITPRVCGLIEHYRVAWKDLWPDDPLEVGVRNMFKMRNDFVHTGHIDMTGRAYIAARRAHILGERLIWQILGAQRDWEDLRSLPRTDDLRALEKELDDKEGSGSSSAQPSS